MLLAPYCRLSPSDLRIRPWQLILLTIQIAGGLALYAVLRPFGEVVAQGAFICVLAPTATSAAVVTGMLGGDVAALAAYCLLGNVSVAIVSPVVFSLIGEQVTMPFLESFATVCRQVVALSLRRFAPRIHRTLQNRQIVSFYLWAVSLTIVMGNTVAFLVRQDASNYRNEIAVAAAALIVCAAQFLLGRRIGKRYGDKVSGAQGLGQKNTVLAIWMAQTYLNPIASVGPASYVVWQNIINSWQLWRKRRNEPETRAGRR